MQTLLQRKKAFYKFHFLVCVKAARKTNTENEVSFFARPIRSRHDTENVQNFLITSNKN